MGALPRINRSFFDPVKILFQDATLPACCLGPVTAVHDLSVFMVTFRVLHTTYKLSKAELATAPQSLLTQAALLQTKSSQVISVEEWPEPQPTVFEVTLCP